jgi:hypothetical protein
MDSSLEVSQGNFIHPKSCSRSTVTLDWFTRNNTKTSFIYSNLCEFNLYQSGTISNIILLNSKYCKNQLSIKLTSTFIDKAMFSASDVYIQCTTIQNAVFKKTLKQPIIQIQGPSNGVLVMINTTINVQSLYIRVSELSMENVALY